MRIPGKLLCPVVENDVSTPPPQRHGGGIGIACYGRWYYGTIYHTQPLYTAHTKSGIHHGIFITAHAAGARSVQTTGGKAAEIFEQGFIALYV